MQVQQLPLFEEPASHDTARESIKNITWSYSRRSTLEQCTRRYYYEYFGANKTTAKAEPHKEVLHFLKNRVKNRYLLSGEALHTAIKICFKQAKVGEIWNTDRLVGFARRIFEDSWLYSRSHPDGNIVPGDEYPPTVLQEYNYKQPDAEDLCTAEENRLIEAIKSFADDERYKQFRFAGRTPNSLVEHMMELADFPCVVTGRIDLTYLRNGYVTIVDWKLGSDEGTGDDSLQLAVYGLWAIDYLKCTWDMLHVCKVHLSSNEIVEFKVNPEVLASARACVIQDAERMATLHEYGSEAVVEAFSRCGKPRVCSFCLYRRICYA